MRSNEKPFIRRARTQRINGFSLCRKHSMIEVVGTYILFLAMYPVAAAMHAAEAPAQFAGWFVVGLAVLLLLRVWHARAAKLWLALWFMPGTIICGAATLLPLPFAVWSLFTPGRCATIASLFVCLLLNIVLVYGIAWVYRRVRRARSMNIKPLVPTRTGEAPVLAAQRRCCAHD